MLTVVHGRFLALDCVWKQRAERLQWISNSLFYTTNIACNRGIMTKNLIKICKIN